MAISAHEMILVLRARDEASRVLRNIEGNMAGLSRTQEAAARKQIAQGAALATVGVGIAAAGAIGVQFFAGAISTAMEYNRQVALTKTQVDKVGVSLGQLSKIGLDVAKTIPVPFKEIQPMLYDIFSSMDVSVSGAEVLLRNFSKAAVAGQVSLQEAGRATIAILNAYRLPATKVNEVNDFMFQLVRKGVGTYGEFASTIGRSIPSAVRAGQTYQALGGMLAFLTRNGLSTAMATASAGRALDAISNPKTVEKLQKFGETIGDALGKSEAVKLFGKNYTDLSIKVKDANGNFLPMVTIMQQLSSVIGKLPPPERAQVLYQLFKSSGGTIQARRFFDVAIPGIKQFTQLTQQMYDNRGQAEAAYKTMLETPAMQAQLLRTRFDALKTEIGNALMPIFSALVNVGNNMISFWNKLDPALRNNIVRFTAVGAVLMVVIGIVIAAAGAFLMLEGAAALAGVALGPIIGIAAGVVVGIAALVALFVLAWNKSTAFQNAVKALGSALMSVAGTIKDAVVVAFNWMVNTAIPWLKSAWANVVAFLQVIWTNMVGWWNTATAAIARIAHAVFDPVIAWMRGLFQGFQDWYAKHAEQLHRIWEYAVNVWRFITQAFGNWIIPFFHNTFNAILNYIKPFWDVLVSLFRAGWATIQFVWRLGSIAISTAWKILWAAVQATVKVAWSIIYNVLAIAWHLISAAFSVFLDLITGHWRTAWEDIKRAAISIWGNLKSMFGTWAREAGGLLKAAGTALWTGLRDAFSAGLKWVVDVAKNIGNAILNAIKGIFHISSPSRVMFDIGANIIKGLWHGLLRFNPTKVITGLFGSLPNALANVVQYGMVALEKLPPAALAVLGKVAGIFTGPTGAALGKSNFPSNVALGKSMAAARGWIGSQWTALYNLWMGESGWNNMARNASSGAFGIPQSLPASKMGAAGAAGNPLAQIAWGLNYIAGRYGSPAAAYSAWLSRSPHWYATGSLHTAPGWKVVGDRGPELMYTPGGDKVFNRGQPQPAVAGKQVTVNQTIYTNEINPRAHGAALAWEVATKVA